MRAISISLFVAVAGCAPGTGVVQLTVDATAPIDGVAALHIHVTKMPNLVADSDFTLDPPRALSHAAPAVLSLLVPQDESGEATLSVVASDGAGRMLASGSSAVQLTPSQVIEAAVTLTAGNAPADFAVLADLATTSDLTTADGPIGGPDMAMPDLAMPDLAMPDLAMPDLAMPDLATPDQAMPDLAMPDLRVVDLATVPDMLMCVGDLSNIGANDLTIAFTVQLAQAPGRVALLAQRSVCNAQDFWDVRTNGQRLEITFQNLNGPVTDFNTTKALADNKPHAIVISRKSQVITVTVDGVFDSMAAAAQSFAALPAFVIGNDPCVGVDGTVALSNQIGSISNVCILGDFPPPPVQVSAVGPTLGPTTGGTALTITGDHFAAGATVTVAGLAATMVKVVSATQITCLAPPNPGHAGKVDITVKNLDGSTATLKQAFNYYYGQVSFAAHVDYASDVEPQNIALADLNGDKILDVVSCHRTGGTFGVSLGKGDGTFQGVVTYPNGGIASSLAVADFNGDKVLDLATISQGNGSAISVVTGKGDGTFNGVKSTPVANALRVAAGDITGDGKIDVVVGLRNANTSGVQIYVGAGDGSFAAGAFLATPDDVQSIAAADVTGDGKLDVVASQTTSLLLFAGQGNSMLGAGVSSMAGGSGQPQGFTFADLNGDGKLDVAAAIFNQGGASVLVNGGNGVLGKFTLIANPGNGTGGVALADIDADGVVDLVVSNLANNTASVLPGKGDGTFAAPITVNVHTRPTSVAAGDLNGDGKVDFVVQNLTTNDFSVILNTSQ